MALLVAIVAWTGGCREAPLPVGESRVDTLAGGTVRVRNGPAPEPSDTLDPVLESLGWGRVAGLALPEGDGVLVLDDFAHAVARLDADGATRWRFGREGDGPGELRSPLGVLLDAGGRVWIPDSGTRRYTVLEPDGTPIRTVPRPLRWDKGWRGRLLSDGTVLEPTSVPSAPGSRFFVRGWVLGEPGAPGRDTFPVVYHPSPTFERPGGGREAGASLEPTVPFTPRLEAAPDPGGHLWLGHADRFRVARVDPAGDTVLLVESDRRPEPVLEREADSALVALRRDFPGYGRALAPRRLPDHHPHFVDVLADDRGRLWVRRFARGEVTAFEVFGPDGRVCGARVLSRRLDEHPVVVAGGRLAGVGETPAGGPSVLVFDVGDPCAGTP